MVWGMGMLFDPVFVIDGILNQILGVRLFAEHHTL